MPMSRKVAIVTITFSVLIGVLGGFVYWIVSDLPNIKLLEEYAPLESSRVYSSDGKTIAEFYVERRTFIPHYKIPQHVKRAFISVEDIRFYNHPVSILLGYQGLCGMTSGQAGSLREEAPLLNNLRGCFS